MNNSAISLNYTFFRFFSPLCILSSKSMNGKFPLWSSPLRFLFLSSYLTIDSYIRGYVPKSLERVNNWGAADIFFKPSNEMKFRPPFFIANFLDRGSKNIISNKTRTLGLIYWYAVRVVGKILHKQNGFTKYWPDHQ